MPPVEPGRKAPAFSVPDQSGARRTLKEFAGRPLVLYFYPKDDTPGCTVEACSFRDAWARFRKAGADVLGVSPDGAASHARFVGKLRLPFALLADEPVSMLDVSVRAGILGLLDDLRRDGLGVLMITHDLSTAARYADRICVMYLGRIVEVGPAAEVIANPRHPYTRALLSVVPRSDPDDRGAPEILRGETPNPADVPSGCRFHPRCPLARDACRTDDPALRPVGAAGHPAACPYA